MDLTPDLNKMAKFTKETDISLWITCVQLVYGILGNSHVYCILIVLLKYLYVKHNINVLNRILTILFVIIYVACLITQVEFSSHFYTFRKKGTKAVAGVVSF